MPGRADSPHRGFTPLEGVSPLVAASHLCDRCLPAVSGLALASPAPSSVSGRWPRRTPASPRGSKALLHARVCSLARRCRRPVALSSLGFAPLQGPSHIRCRAGFPATSAHRCASVWLASATLWREVQPRRSRWPFTVCSTEAGQGLGWRLCGVGVAVPGSRCLTPRGAARGAVGR